MATCGDLASKGSDGAHSPSPDFKVHFPAPFVPPSSFSPCPRRDTKVNQDDSPSPTQHDIVRIDVAVSDPLSGIVEVPKCRRELVRDRARYSTKVIVTVVGREGGRIEQVS